MVVMRDAMERYKELEKEAWSLLSKLGTLQEHILGGVQYLDENDEPVYPDNVVQFKRK